MSPISFFQRHPRADLSAYLDGELTPAATLRLEGHIAACAACAAQLGELRETRSALRSFPEAAAPRSFALTPEMARDARPVRQALPPRRVQPLVNGLRMASGGLAVALAVVVVIGVSGGGSDSADEGATGVRVLQNDSTQQYSAGAPEASMGLTQDEDLGDNAGGAPAETPLAGALRPGSTSAGLGGDSLPLTGAAGVSVPTEDATAAQSPPDEFLDGDVGASTTDIPKAASGEFDSATPLPETASLASDSAADDSGLGTLTIVAIVLGVLLAAALIGSIAASRLARKTP